MTAQRLVRGSKTRIVLGICGVCTIITAIYHHENIVSQLENVKKSYVTCQQQQESLQVNLQVIVDYKNRLEKSLQTEKNEHKHTKTELEKKVNNEKLQRDKSSVEANLRFTSLQQHYKLLQAKYDDFQTKADKLQQQYLQEIEQLDGKVKELQEDLKKAQDEKEKSMERLKTEYLQLQIDKEELQKKLKANYNDRESQMNQLMKENHQLKKDIDELKNGQESLRNQPNDEKNNIDRVKQNKDESPKIPMHNEKQVDLMDLMKNNQTGIEIAQFNVNDNVLPKPGNNNSKLNTSSTVSSNLNNAQQIVLATMAAIDGEAKMDDNLQIPQTEIRLPKGVVPPPKTSIINDKEQRKNDKVEDKNIPDEINLALPNRYRNNIIENEMQKEIIKETKPDAKPKLQDPPEMLNQDHNAAMEVIDQPKIHDNSLDNNNNEHNDIAVDENDRIKDQDPIVKHIERRKKQHIDTLGLGGRGNEGVMHAPLGGNYEAEADYDKDVHKDDLQLDENVEQEGEEDDDADDYDANLQARQKDPAVRN